MKHKLRFGLALGRLAVLKMSEIKLKYDFYVFTGKKNEKIDFIYIVASPLKSHIV
jgi:hypothetical protein